MISYAVWLYARFTLSLRDVEELLRRGRSTSHTKAFVGGDCVTVLSMHVASVASCRGAAARG